MGEPLPICFLNDEFLPLREARISPLDRGFLYSDGAYEVTPVYGGRPFRFAAAPRPPDAQPAGNPHGRSADARGVARSVSRAHQPQRRRSSDAYIYVQVTRGAEYGRNHAPLPDVPRTVFAFASPWPTGRRRLARERPACDHRRRTRAGRAATSSPCRCWPTCCCASSRWMQTPARPSCCATAS